MKKTAPETGAGNEETNDVATIPSNVNDWQNAPTHLEKYDLPIQRKIQLPTTRNCWLIAA